jgi:5-methylcytosine-specific restriction endonuclease McrA
MDTEDPRNPAAGCEDCGNTGRRVRQPFARALEFLYGFVNPQDPLYATTRHIVPVSKGGRDHISNMMLAHAKCNNDLGDKEPWQKDPGAADAAGE